VPQVAAWASIESARLTNPEEREPLIAPLAGARDFEVRLLGLIASDLLAPDVRTRVPTHLVNDPDPLVSGAAQAQLELLHNPPRPIPAGAQRPQRAGPATLPATGPA